MNRFIENVKINVRKGECHEHMVPSVCKSKHLEQGAKALMHYKQQKEAWKKTIDEIDEEREYRIKYKK